MRVYNNSSKNKEYINNKQQYINNKPSRLTLILSIIICGVDVGMNSTDLRLSFLEAYAIAFPALPPELPTIVEAPADLASIHVLPIPRILNEPGGCRLSNFKYTGPFPKNFVNLSLNISGVTE